MKLRILSSLLLLGACGSSQPAESTVTAVQIGGSESARAAAAEAGPALDEGALSNLLEEDEAVRIRVPVTDAQPSRGPESAPVTIVVFSDFQCPFCSRVVPTIERILESYPAKVRFVWRNNPLPFHQRAYPAASLAMAAFDAGGDELFWTYHDLLFQNQRDLSDANLRMWASSSLSEQVIQQALNTNPEPRIQADQDLARQIGARGTPNFFINGRQLTGAQPYEAFAAVIDEELQFVAQLRNTGLPQGEVYARLMRDARTDPPPPAPRPGRPARREPDPAAVYNLPLSGNEPSRGPADALVTIVEFSDFQCPFCSRVEPTLDEILQRYPQDVRVVWMNNPLPFHQNAMPAAELAAEAHRQGGDAMFWAAHQAIFRDQRNLERPALLQIAQQLQMNVQEVIRALDTRRHQAMIEGQQDTARRLGASGTPSFFINGRNLRGAQPAAAFSVVIDEELARARQLVAAGTPRAGVYAEAVRNGATEPQFLPGGGGGNAAAPTPRADTVYTIPSVQDAPSRGGQNAPVVIQQFSDFECPFCSRVEPTLRQLEQEFGNQIRLEWRNYPLPFHQHAELAAEAAHEIFTQRGSEAFWQYAELLFQNQRGGLERADLVRYARQIRRVNIRRFEAALDQHTHQARIQADMAAVRTAGARIGTPSFFVNGRLLQGAQPIGAFRDAVQRALREAGQGGQANGAQPSPTTPAGTPIQTAAPSDVAAPPANAQRTPSGLASRVLRPGTGSRHPTATDRVEVHYSGWTTDGNLFDSSINRGRTATFPLNAVIAGWTEGVQLMVEGEQRRFWIPESLAYQGRPGRPAGVLVFDVELISIQ